LKLATKQFAEESRCARRLACYVKRGAICAIRQRRRLGGLHEDHDRTQRRLRRSLGNNGSKSAGQDRGTRRVCHCAVRKLDSKDQEPGTTASAGTDSKRRVDGAGAAKREEQTKRGMIDPSYPEGHWNVPRGSSRHAASGPSRYRTGSPGRDSNPSSGLGCAANTCFPHSWIAVAGSSEVSQIQVLNVTGFSHAPGRPWPSQRRRQAISRQDRPSARSTAN